MAKQKMKQTAKERLLETGARIIHQKGYNHTGINEILDASGVPKGSFYFYFKSKEDFGLQLIDFFLLHFLHTADKYLAQPGVSSLDKFRRFFDDFLNYFESRGFTGGCPIGNFSLEMGDLNEHFREKLDASFLKMKQKIGLFLQAALDNGELKPGLDLDEAADFILNSWEGALLRLKVTRTRTQMVLFYKVVFDCLLRKKSKH
jgi:TetR/AcrR family transcriptional regulator, transcriptional repressor for nem operon